MTLEEILKRKVKREQALAALLKDLERLEAKQQKADEAANEAADRGDVDGYVKMKKEEAEAAAAIDATKAIIEKRQECAATIEEAQAAWADFLKAESKEATKRRERFESALAETQKAFHAMMETETKMYGTRKRCGALCGFPYSQGGSPNYDLIRTFPMPEWIDRAAYTSLQQYIIFLQRSGAVPADECVRLNMIFTSQGDSL